jgi:hypothetical protein
VFKGIAASTLAVAVDLKEAAALPASEASNVEASSWVSQAPPVIAENRWQKQRQQQQQQ